MTHASQSEQNAAANAESPEPPSFTLESRILNAALIIMLIMLGVALGAISGAFIGLFTGWIRIYC